MSMVSYVLSYLPELKLLPVQALVAMDLDLLMSTCERMSVDDVFGETSPAQPIVLALINQLSRKLAENFAIKSSYLMEAVQALDLDDEVVSFRTHISPHQ